MTETTSRGRTAARALGLGVVVLATALAGPREARAKLEIWRTEGASAFGKGKRERVVISDAGKVRLARAVKPVGTLDAARVWDLARDPDGAVYAATGDEGKVFRRGPGGDAAWSAVYDAADTQALSLAVGPRGHVFVGTGPSGRVVDVTDPKHPSSKPGPGVQYVWDLASDPGGNLVAATGPKGQLWKRSAADGAWSLLHDSKHSHLLSVAIAADGTVYAGSDGEGLIYKVTPGGKVSVVYDAPQAEVRSLLIGSDGTLYAGTAAEAGGGSGRGPGLFPTGGLTGSVEPGPRPVNAATAPAEAQKKADDPKRPADAPRSQGGTAAPRPVTAGDNALYMIDPEGVVREIFRARALMFALAESDAGLYVGTGPEGVLYEILGRGRETSPVARLDSGQVLALLREPDGGLLVGAGDPGSVARLESGHVAEGDFLSEVHDTKLISRFGALSWRADAPEGTAVGVRVRSGNVSEPDPTWSEWSAEQTDPESSRALAPPGRFVQYRVSLRTKDPRRSPAVSAVALGYQTANLPPEVTKLDVPDVSALEGASRQTKLTLRWDVTDPNDDDLSYSLAFQKEGWPSWVVMTDRPLTEKTYAWDAGSLPSGRYRVRLTATDRPSNNPKDALERERVSESFVVDTEPPAVTIKAGGRGATAGLKDRLTRIVKAAYALDGGEWVPVFADDGLFDTAAESVTIALPDLKPGTHVLVVRATDAAGNTGSADTLIPAP